MVSGSGLAAPPQSHGQYSCFLGTLVATSHFPRELQLPVDLAGILSQSCRGKSLELVASWMREHVDLGAGTRGPVPGCVACSGGHGIALWPRHQGHYAEVPLGNLGEKWQLLALPPLPPTGLDILPEEAHLQPLAILCCLQRAAPLEGLVGDM